MFILSTNKNMIYLNRRISIPGYVMCLRFTLISNSPLAPASNEMVMPSYLSFLRQDNFAHAPQNENQFF